MSRSWFIWGFVLLATTLVGAVVLLVLGYLWFPSLFPLAVLWSFCGGVVVGTMVQAI